MVTNTLIANNTIKKTDIGIGLLRYSNTLVRDNLVKDLNTSGTPTYGIRVQACQNITVRSNTVQQNGNNNPATFGISIQLSEDILTTCNALTKTDVGIQVAGPSVGTTILQNTFKNNNTGFFLSNNGFIDDQFRGTAPNYLPSDNQWVGAFNLHTDVDNTSNTPPSLDFYIRTNNVYFPTLNGGGPSAINFIPTTGPQAFCTSIVPGPPGPKSKLIIQGQVGITPAEKGIAQQSLFSQLRTDTTLLSDPDFNTFHATCNSIAIGTLMENNKALANPDTTGLTAELINCQNTVPLNVPEANLKQVALIGLNNRINVTELTPQQITNLQVLAAKCPFTDGVAVFQARALLLHVDSTIYFNACESYMPNGNNERLIINDESNTYESKNTPISIYPNPSKEIIYINHPNIKNGIILIYNMLGEKILERKLMETIDIKQFINGIYFIKIIHNNKLIHSQKLIIQ